LEKIDWSCSARLGSCAFTACSVPYQVEVLKSGAVLGTQELGSKGHYVFGRTPGCDFVLEHPSASRLHAVLQFNRETKGAHLYDNASTHGTFVNKGRIKPHVHVPLRCAPCKTLAGLGILVCLELEEREVLEERMP
jgi:pSer/pThr/pTyr-binding forkhead associated (FHA) protein